MANERRCPSLASDFGEVESWTIKVTEMAKGCQHYLLSMTTQNPRLTVCEEIKTILLGE